MTCDHHISRGLTENDTYGGVISLTTKILICYFELWLTLLYPPAITGIFLHDKKTSSIVDTIICIQTLIPILNLDLQEFI